MSRTQIAVDEWIDPDREMDDREAAAEDEYQRWHEQRFAMEKARHERKIAPEYPVCMVCGLKSWECGGTDRCAICRVLQVRLQNGREACAVCDGARSNA